MSIKYQVLGRPGGDNAAFVWVNSGKKVTKILLDCGEDLLKEVNHSDIKTVDYLLLSHLHIDHIAGFDYFFRRNYNNFKNPVRIFGPPETSSIIHHRLLGFMWNLHGDIPEYWYVTDIDENELRTFRFASTDGFNNKEFVEVKPHNGRIIDNKFFHIDTALLNHQIPSAAYRIQEKTTCNVEKENLAQLSLQPGIWLETVKDLEIPGDEEIIVDEKLYKLSSLRKRLLRLSEGDSFAYLTDFLLDEESKLKAAELIKNCRYMLCESQYSSYDAQFADQNFHLTTRQAAELAKIGNVQNLILFHISERYSVTRDLKFLLDEAKEIFKDVNFPPGWLNSSGG